MAHRRLGLPALVATALAPAVAGCGSASSAELPASAGPARAPALSRTPAGRVFPVGPEPAALAADPVTGQVAVATRAPDRLVFLDPRTGRIVRRVPVPGPAADLALAAPGGPLLAATPSALTRIGLPRGAIRPPLTAAPGSAVTAIPATGRTYVADPRTSTLTALQGPRVIARARTGLEPGDVEPAGRGRLVAVLARKARTVELYDARTLARRATATAGLGPTHVVSDGRDRLYVVDTAGDALLVYHLRPRFELTRRLSLQGGPYGVAIDPQAGRIWIAMTRTNVLSELAGGGRPRVLRSFPSVRQASAVAVDTVTGRVWVAGAADGVVQALEPPALRLPRAR